MKRLVWVGLCTFVAALLLALVLHSSASRPDAQTESVEPLPRFDLGAELSARGLDPYRLQVPKDHEVHLVIRGGTDAPEGILTLLGYEDLVAGVDMGPGQGRELVFSSTRPGDDFALTLGGTVLGRLEVTGAHLEEGRE